MSALLHKKCQSQDNLQKKKQIDKETPYKKMPRLIEKPLQLQ